MAAVYHLENPQIIFPGEEVTIADSEGSRKSLCKFTPHRTVTSSDHFRTNCWWNLPPARSYTAPRRALAAAHSESASSRWRLWERQQPLPVKKNNSDSCQNVQNSLEELL